MAIVIQNLIDIVNVLDDTKAAGLQIIQTIAKTSTANGQANTPYNVVHFVNNQGVTIYRLNLDGTIKYQDIGGVSTLWVGTLDAFLNKINDEYFIGSSGGALPTGAATEEKQMTVQSNEFTDNNGEYFYQIQKINVDNSVALIYVDKNGVTVVPDLPSMVSTSNLIAERITDIKNLCDDIYDTLRLENWQKIVGNSILRTIVPIINPSGAANLEKEEYKTGGTTIFTITYSYNIVNAITNIVTT